MLCQKSGVAWLLYLLVFLPYGGYLATDAEKVDKTIYRTDRSKWVDPHDFLHNPADFDPEQVIVKREEQLAEADCTRNQVDIEQYNLCSRDKRIVEQELKICKSASQGPDAGPYYLQFVRQLEEKFRRVGSYDNKFSVEIQLSDLQLDVFKELLHEAEINHIHPSTIQDTNHILLNMIEDIVPWNRTLKSNFVEAVESFIGIPFSFIVQLMNLIVATVMLIYFVNRLRISLYKLLLWGFVIMFLVSIVWTWLHLYKQKVAEKIANAMQLPEIPPECRPQDMTWQGSMTNWLKDTFTFAEDRCVKYHENYIVNPLWEVPPTKAIATTVSRLVFVPLEETGASINRFFQASLRGLPVQWSIFVFAFIVVMTTLLILTCSGYSFSVPFLFSLRPREIHRPNIEYKELDRRILTLTDQLSSTQQLILEQSSHSQIKAAGDLKSPFSIQNVPYRHTDLQVSSIPTNETVDSNVLNLYEHPNSKKKSNNSRTTNTFHEGDGDRGSSNLMEQSKTEKKLQNELENEEISSTNLRGQAHKDMRSGIKIKPRKQGDICTLHDSVETVGTSTAENIDG